MGLEALPAGWTVWSEEPGGRVVLAYRPDVFDTEAFPAPCMPTIYVSSGDPRRPPRPGRGGTGGWRVTLRFEPEVEGPAETFDDRASAVAGAVDLAARFARGEVDYRGYYQLPREAYLAKLDDLTGGEP